MTRRSFFRRLSSAAAALAIAPALCRLAEKVAVAVPQNPIPIPTTWTMLSDGHILRYEYNESMRQWVRIETTMVAESERQPFVNA